MGNLCLSKEASNDKAIGALMKRDHKMDNRGVKLLLLGAGESGKSTIFKQMRILFGHGYDEEKRRTVAPDLIANLVEGAKDILEYGIANDMLSSDTKELGSIFTPIDKPKKLSPAVAKAIEKIWAKDDFLAVWDKRSLFQVQDTWGELADQVSDYPSWGGSDWVPSVEDVMRGRIRTSGVVDETYTIKDIDFHLYDVGGQRNERRKWQYLFRDVTALIFVAAISEYDQVLFEDSKQNRLLEALELFQDITNGDDFYRKPILLFLNKRDLFKEKLCERLIPINVTGYFPDAPSGTVVYEDGVEWMKKKFLSLVPAKSRIYTHVTCARDTQNIKVVFNVCSDIILRENLRLNGFMSPTEMDEDFDDDLKDNSRV